MHELQEDVWPLDLPSGMTSGSKSTAYDLLYKVHIEGPMPVENFPGAKFALINLLGANLIDLAGGQLFITDKGKRALVHPYHYDIYF